jgi:hypothetical protein
MGTKDQVWRARNALAEAIAQQKRGLVDMPAVYRAADAYIAAIRAHADATGRKLPVPSRAKIIRLLG